MFNYRIVITVIKFLHHAGLIRVTSETAKTSNLIEDGDGQSVQQQLTEKVIQTILSI